MLPSGVSRAEVLRDAVTLVDSEDPVLRDEVGYGLAVQWLYREQALTPAELKSLGDALLARLAVPPSGGDSVLGRSFSALWLSMAAAAESKKALLDEPTFAALLEAGAHELEAEIDLRGYEPKLGWIHATAHTSDLLKFLARDPRLTGAQQERIVASVRARLEKGDTFAWAEDERLAAVLRSLINRADFQPAPLEAWLASLPPRLKALWSAPALDTAEFARLNATKQVLRALLVFLPAEHPQAARLLETLDVLSG
ncbi:MAG: DUF2785 domain-containing protein [Myxococcus sp.]|nr:DUF2785 domain-containing protein [Myxococcus sp.]